MATKILWLWRIRISIVVSIVACRASRGQDLRYFWLGLLLGRDVFLRSQKFQDNLYDFAGLFVGVADIFISWPWWMMLLPRGALRREGESPRPFDSSQFRQLFLSPGVRVTRDRTHIFVEALATIKSTSNQHRRNSAVLTSHELHHLTVERGGGHIPNQNHCRLWTELPSREVSQEQ